MDRVAADAERSKFDHRRLRHAPERPTLKGPRERRPRPSKPCYRGDVDDRSSAAFHHSGQNGSHSLIDLGCVHGHDLLEQIGICCREWGDAEDTGIVHEDIDSSATCRRLADDGALRRHHATTPVTPR